MAKTKSEIEQAKAESERRTRAENAVLQGERVKGALGALNPTAWALHGTQYRLDIEKALEDLITAVRETL